MLKKIFYIIVIFIFGMFGGIFANQIFWPYFVERPLFYKYNLDRSPVYVTERKEIVIKENEALQNAIEKVEKAIIGIEATAKTGNIIKGSGLIVTSDGLVVALSEILPSNDNFSFLVNGKVTKYQILKRDVKENLVLIKLEGDRFSTVGFSDFEKIKLGERVFLMGFVKENNTIKKIVNDGVIRYISDIIIDTNIYENNNIKGSPVFDIEGNFIGLGSIDKGGRVVVIPVDKIKNFIGL